MRIRQWMFGLGLLGCGLSVSMPPTALAQTPARALVALTIDDLPDHGPIEPAGQSWNGTFLEQFSNAKGAPRPPADGFFQEVAAVCR